MALGGDLETLARAYFTNLSGAELKICQAAAKGELAICGPSDDQHHPTNDPSKAEQWPTERHVRAEVIRWLCVAAKEKIDPSGVQMFGARITGPLHLSHVTVQFPLAFACCQFTGEIVLEGAQTRTVSFVKTYLGSIYADGAVVQGAVFIRDGSHCSGELRFTGAQIEGQFNCSRSLIQRDGGPSSDGSLAALILDGAIVNGAVILRDGFRATSEVRMLRARIGSDLDCEGGSFTSSKSPSDDYLSPALDVDGVSVGGSIYLRHGFRADGLVKLLGARVGLNLDCIDGEFNNAPREKLSGSGESLGADLAVIEGSVLLADGFLATGFVRFISSRIGGDLRCTNATFRSGLVVERAVINGTFYWRDIAIQPTTQLDLMNTTVGSLSDDEASWPPAGRLQLYGFVYGRISVSSPRQIRARLAWLGRLAQFSTQPYQEFAKFLRSEGSQLGSQRVLFRMEDQRRKLENRQFFARAWSFLLKVTVGYGYYPSRPALWWLAALTLVGCALFWAGYRAGNVVPTDKEAYTAFENEHRPPSYYGTFHAFIFSLENSFQLVKLGQADRWQPNTDRRRVIGSYDGQLRQFVYPFVSPSVLLWFRWGQIVCGWFFTTMALAGVAGIVRKE
jgi:hypothetical protein